MENDGKIMEFYFWISVGTLYYVSIEANSVDPDQTSPIGAIWFGSKLFDQGASETFQQMT